MEELAEYERQYLKPLKNQLEQVQQAGAALCQTVQPGIGRRKLEQELSAAAAAIDNLYTAAGNAEQNVDVGLAFSGQFVDGTRRLESLIQQVGFAHGNPKVSFDELRWSDMALNYFIS